MWKEKYKIHVARHIDPLREPANIVPDRGRLVNKCPASLLEDRGRAGRPGSTDGGAPLRNRVHAGQESGA